MILLPPSPTANPRRRHPPPPQTLRNYGDLSSSTSTESRHIPRPDHYPADILDIRKKVAALAI